MFKKRDQIQKPFPAPFWRGFGVHFGHILGSKSLPKRSFEAKRAYVELWRPWRELRGQILDTFVKSEGWGGGPGAEGTGVR